MHEVGNQIGKLVKIAYLHQDPVVCAKIGLKIFSRAWNQTTLQQHLLSRRHQTVSETAWIAQKPSITPVDDEVNIKAQPVPDIQKTLGMIQGLVGSYNKVIEQMQQNSRTPYRNQQQERNLQIVQQWGPPPQRNTPKPKTSWIETGIGKRE